MKRVLIDTSAYSALLRGDERVKASVQRADELYFNPIVIGELRAGFAKEQPRDNQPGIFSDFLSTPRVRLEDITDGTAERYALIFEYLRRLGKPVPTNDLWIAASAMDHGLRLVTTDSHFRLIPQIVVECFDPQ